MTKSIVRSSYHFEIILSSEGNNITLHKFISYHYRRRPDSTPENFLKHDFEYVVGLKVPPSEPAFWSGLEAQDQ